MLRPTRTVVRWLTAATFLLMVLLVARIHACACTGGPPTWRPVDLTGAGPR